MNTSLHPKFAAGVIDNQGSITAHRADRILIPATLGLAIMD